MPSIGEHIRASAEIKFPRQDVKFNRRNIYARDGNKCQYCGEKYATTELSLDHVTPRSQGGRSTWDNIVCCCIKCNVKKGGRTPEQAHMHLVSKPHKPKRSPVINIRLAEALLELETVPGFGVLVGGIEVTKSHGCRFRPC